MQTTAARLPATHRIFAVMTNRPLLEARDLHRSYGSLQVLRGVSLDIAAGEVISIVGASGAGKSTLLHILGTLDRPDEGSYTVDGRDVLRLNRRDMARFRNEEIGFIFQFHHLLPEFTAVENVHMPALIAGRDGGASLDRAHWLLDELGLSDRADHRPRELSGGEQQRVAVARSLMNEPSIVLADEPSGNLDSATSHELHRLFFDLRDRFGQTFVIVTHNRDLASMADRRLEMRDGRLVD